MSALLGLFVLAPKQFPAIARVVIVVVVSVVIRLLLARRFAKAPRSAKPSAAVAPLPPWAIRAVEGAGLLVLAGTIYFSQASSVKAMRGDVLYRRRPADTGPMPGKPIGSLFLVADSQFHELLGDRDGGQLDMIDKVVPVAVRPVELDLLSGATLAHFAEIYGELQKSNTSLKWAHLGDFGDLGCRSEIEERLPRYVDLFGRGDRLAALVPGNHDSAFVGNFLWHPDWGKACRPSHLVDKEASDRILAGLGGGTVRTHLLAGTTWLAGATRISDGVAGAFLDSSDYMGLGFNLGIAAVEGSISMPQRLQIVRDLDSLGGGLKVVLFLHHPYDTLSAWGKWNIERIAKHLGSRLLALVSAHTHFVGCRQHTFGGRTVPELVISSTTDPPQEAALLEIFQDSDRHWIRLRTIPAVSRSKKSDSLGFRLSTQIAGEDCRRVIERLQEPESSEFCKQLFQWELLRRPDDPEELKENQQPRAMRLLKCIALKDVPKDPLTYNPKLPNLWTELDRQIIDAFQKPSEPHPADRKTLVCLSWAASVLQGHKRESWGYGGALDYALEDSVAYAAKQIVAEPGNPKRGCPFSETAR